jgi:flagellar motor switch protein FliG
MKKIKGGIDAAAELLNGLPPEQMKKIMSEIKARDPKTFELIEKSLVTMDDLKYLTPGMCIGLLRELNLSELGIALRGVSQEVTEHLFKMVSTNIRLEIEEGLKGKPVKVQLVGEAQQKILSLLRQKILKGEIVLSKGSSDTIV